MRPDNRISRRSLLRGAGTAMALPLLDAMIPPFARAATAKSATPTRMEISSFPATSRTCSSIKRATNRLPWAT